MTSSTSYGLLRLRGLQLALPLTALREVIPSPARFIELPVRAGGLLGAVELRDRVIPVVDLAGAVDGLAGGTAVAPGASNAPGPAGHVVAVVVHDGQVLGLLADDAAGIAAVDDARLQRLAASDGRLVITHTFTRPDDGSVAGLLDVERLFRLPGVPALREVVDHADAAGLYSSDRSVVDRTRPVMTLRVGALLVGLDAVSVHTVLPTLTIEPSPLTGGACLGVTRHGDVAVPVVDTLAVLDVGTLGPADVRRGILLSLGQGFVALALTEVLDIVPVAGPDLLTVPPRTLRRPDLFVGVLPSEAGQLLLVDGARLQGEPLLLGLSACTTGGGDGAASSSSSSSSASGAPTDDDGYGRAGTTYLTYTIGEPADADVATPLDQVAEIVPLDPRRALVGTGEPPVLGMLSHRDGTLPLLDLGEVLGRSGCAGVAGAAVLLVQGAVGMVGYVVSELRAIERSGWEEEQEPGADPLAPLARRPLLQLAGGESRPMVPMVDLVALADHLFPAAEVPAAEVPAAEVPAAEVPGPRVPTSTPVPTPPP